MLHCGTTCKSRSPCRRAATSQPATGLSEGQHIGSRNLPRRVRSRSSGLPGYDRDLAETEHWPDGSQQAKAVATQRGVLRIGRAWAAGLGIE